MAQLEHRSRRKFDSNPSPLPRRSGSGVPWRPRLIEGIPEARRTQFRTAKPPKLRRRTRLFDFVFGASLIIFLAPLMLVIAVLVKLDCGPILYGHRRVGANGQNFRCWKFRSMVVNAARVLAVVLRSNAEACEQWQRDFKLKSHR